MIGQQKYILPYREERKGVAPGGSYLHVMVVNFFSTPTRSKRASLLYRVETGARCPNGRENGGPELKNCGKRIDEHGYARRPGSEDQNQVHHRSRGVLSP
jgi:hypothetical protein